MEDKKMNKDDISDFDIDTWLDNIDDTSTPEWLKAGAETGYYNAFISLVKTCKQNILESDSPNELAFNQYQVSIVDVCEAKGVGRSALREERMPKLHEHIEETNQMLCALRKREISTKQQAQGYKNKPELKAENDALKVEVNELKDKLHRQYMDMLIENSGSSSIEDKVQKIADLEERNVELERQVARMTQRLRNQFKAIE